MSVGASKMTSVGAVPPQIFFDSKIESFSVWKIKFMVYAESAGLECMFNVVEADTKLSRPDIDKKAKVALVLSLDGDTISMLRDVSESSAAALWTQLLEHYERKSAASVFHLKMALSREHMRPGEKVDALIKRINSLADQRRLIDDPVSDSDLLFYLLKGVSNVKSYDATATTIGMLPNMKYQDACAHLRDYELKLLSDQSNEIRSSTEQAVYFVRDGTECKHCHKTGHAEKDCDWNNKSCFICHKKGHFAKDCDKSKDKRSNKDRSMSDDNLFIG